ncbi:DEAD/DEAH box helicase [Clostridium celatum]|uniref:DEAD/DEAH box helicase n=1 Tax=Clostridium celatum TaxID=36834 RepID=UPI001897FFAB|nr:DEAD/DEAH box helicase [Clostridium celatum]
MKEGIYEQVMNKEILEQLNNLEQENFIIDKDKIDKEEAKVILSQYISRVIRKSLNYIRDKEKEDSEKLIKQIEACNNIINILSEVSNEEDIKKYEIDKNGEMLNALYFKVNNKRALTKKQAIRPVTPLSQSSLFTGSGQEPNMLGELNKEILSCDSIDLLVSFVKWSGIRCIIESLREATQSNNKKLRIITTSYMGATDVKAIEELSKLPNTEIKISYDTERTRLHAKAYMFKRDTGFTTAYIGSSNLSNVALTSGLEWNLKITEQDSFDIIKKFEATFESYWNDLEFVSYNGTEEDKKRLQASLRKEQKDSDNELNFSFDIRPYAYQKEILEKLKVERKIFNKNKNLVIAATGVGKTVISAFDYRDFCKENRGKANRLLFVVHREEILKQARDTFRTILKNNNFGELMVGGRTPESLEYLFVSIQSLNSRDLCEITSDDYYDFIIVDEFHHAAAPSYQRLLSYYKPKVLLGLTATPERNDNKDIFKYFEDRISGEIRLPEAIDRKLLSPFQYFAVSDSVDLSKLKWQRKGYNISELDKVYTGNDIRVNNILTSLNKYITDINEVVGLGFCVSKEHAKFMAQRFNEAGIESLALTDESKKDDRNSAKEKLVNGELKFIFVVDIYNEGMDIPEVNTILFLRPTESLTVFLQQLGRGLRLSEGKECLTVLDYVGQAHVNYNFEEKFRALIGKTNNSVKNCIENGFLSLPKGCYIQLEKEAKEYILRNIKSAANTKSNLLNKLRTFKGDTELELTLENFLNYHNLSLVDFYGKSKDRSFAKMCVMAEQRTDFNDENEDIITKKLCNLFFINSRRFIEFVVSLIRSYDDISNVHFSNEEGLMLNMMYYIFYNDAPQKIGLKSLKEGINKLLNNKVMMNEVCDILDYNYKHLDFIDKKVDLGYDCPLDLHCDYSTDVIMSAFGYYNEEKKPAFREGVKYFEDKKTDIFFITLNKSDKDFSPSTLYEDYAINERLFHWQTQSKTSIQSATGQRYINHLKNGNKIALFVREHKARDGLTSPFTYLGTCEYRSHSGNKPISFVWKLQEEIPASMINKANKSIII